MTIDDSFRKAEVFLGLDDDGLKSISALKSSRKRTMMLEVFV